MLRIKNIIEFYVVPDSTMFSTQKPTNQQVFTVGMMLGKIYEYGIR